MPAYGSDVKTSYRLWVSRTLIDKYGYSPKDTKYIVNYLIDTEAHRKKGHSIAVAAQNIHTLMKQHKKLYGDDWLLKRR